MSSKNMGMESGKTPFGRQQTSENTFKNRQRSESWNEYTLVLSGHEFIRRYEVPASVFMQEQSRLQLRRTKNSPAVQVVGIMHPRELTANSHCVVFTEHIVRTLDQTGSLSVAEALFTLQQLLRLFKALLYTFNAVCVSEKYCGFSAQGQVLGWFNPRFCDCSPTQPITKSESAIVRNLIQIVYAKCSHRDHRLFHDILEIQCQFEGVLDFLKDAHAKYAISYLFCINFTSGATRRSNISFNRNHFQTSQGGSINAIEASFKPSMENTFMPVSVKHSSVSLNGVNNLMSSSCTPLNIDIRTKFSQTHNRKAMQWERAQWRSNQKINEDKNQPYEDMRKSVGQFDIGFFVPKDRRAERVLEKAKKCYICSNQYNHYYEPPARKQSLDYSHKQSFISENTLQKSEIYNQVLSSIDEERRVSHSASKRSKMTAQTNSQIHSTKASLNAGPICESKIQKEFSNTGPIYESKIQREFFNPRMTFGMVQENLCDDSPSNSRMMIKQAISRFEEVKREQNINFMADHPQWRNFIGDLMNSNDQNLKHSYHVSPDVRAEPLRLQLLKHFGREIRESCIHIEDH